MKCFPFAVIVLFGAFAVVHSEPPHIEGAGRREVEQHTAITLECRLSPEAKNVSWYRDDTEVIASAEKEITITSEPPSASASRKSVLTIAEAEKADSGAYKCKVGGVSSNVVEVSVTGSQHPLTAPSKLVSLIPGSQLTLSCQGDIHTHIVWYKGEMLIKSGSDITVKDSDNEAEHIRTSTLTVKHATAANVGSYSCRDEHHDEERVVITVISSDVAGQAGVGYNWITLSVGLMISLRLLQ